MKRDSVLHHTRLRWTRLRQRGAFNVPGPNEELEAVPWDIKDCTIDEDETDSSVDDAGVSGLVSAKSAPDSSSIAMGGRLTPLSDLPDACELGYRTNGAPRWKWINKCPAGVVSRDDCERNSSSWGVLPDRTGTRYKYKRHKLTFGRVRCIFTQLIGRVDGVCEPANSLKQTLPKSRLCREATGDKVSSDTTDCDLPSGCSGADPRGVQASCESWETWAELVSSSTAGRTATSTYPDPRDVQREPG
jgi:hypothetical protein